MTAEFYFEPTLNKSAYLAAPAASAGGYIHRDSPYKAVDPYPELKAFENSRMPGYLIWGAGRFKPFTMSSNCGGYVPGGNYKKLSKSCFRATHHGIDLSATSPDRAARKDTLIAPFNATVIKAGKLSGYGNRVEMILDDTQIILMFSHMAEGLLVKSGQEILAGTIIGYEDNTGCDGCGDHLHLEVCDGRQVKYAIGTWLPHASVLHKNGLLWNPWYIFNFNLTSDD